MSNMLNLFGGGNTTNQPLTATGYTPGGASSVTSPYANALASYGNILNQYGSLYDQAGANQGGYVQSVISPTLQTNAQMYGNLLNDQSLRGIRGSSFGGDQLANFTNAANTNVSNQIANALQQSLGLQSGLLGQEAAATSGLAGTAGGLGSYLNQLSGQGLNYNLGLLSNNRLGAAQNANLFGTGMLGINQLMGGSSKGGNLDLSGIKNLGSGLWSGISGLFSGLGSAVGDIGFGASDATALAAFA